MDGHIKLSPFVEEVVIIRFGGQTTNNLRPERELRSEGTSVALFIARKTVKLHLYVLFGAAMPLRVIYGNAKTRDYEAQTKRKRQEENDINLKPPR